MTDDPFAQFKLTFFEECTELLTDMEQNLGLVESGSFDNETLHAIFRAVHSIKAGADAFSFKRMVAFTHRFEFLLDLLREEKLAVDEPLVDTLFKSFDVLSDLVSFAQNGEEPDAEYGQDALAAIEGYLSGDVGSQPAAEATTDKPVVEEKTDQAVVETADVQSKEEGINHFRIEFTPKEAMYRHANEPLLIIRELMELGEITTTIDTERLPELAKLEPEDAYFSWVFELKTRYGRDDVDEVFEFVIDDCDLTIVTLGDDNEVVSVDVSPGHDSDDDDDFGFFVDDEALKSGVVDANPKPVEEAVAETKPAEVKAPAAAAPAATTPAAPTGPAAKAAMPKSASIRVDVDRVDRLVNMVGELVITQSMLAQEVNNSAMDQSSNVTNGMEELSMHIRELQENVMSIRMQPVKSVFARMPRIVRDVSKKVGKKVKLITEGETTEVDKTVIEELADPLTHMIRNSLDHGLETPEERLAAGKGEEGTIRLSAEHRGGRIVIEITDDGRGINREKVLSLAKEKGIVAEDASLSDEEIDNLIFAPGFSTADEVTDLSGRGVGMDVVRRNIQALGGRVSVTSTPGVGARFQLTLPLTLAVLDGMIVGASDEKYVIPINNIIETVRPPSSDVETLIDGNKVIRIRGEYIRVVSVARMFGDLNASNDPSKGLVVLVEADGGKVIGLHVDMLAGQQQVVIKSLETNYRAVKGIASATILGDGSVCLILDIDALARMEVPKIKKPELMADSFVPKQTEQTEMPSAEHLEAVTA
ncbi:chemotaxis protein CheA [Kordiimonas sp. SCSIO 12603]|uniref:chemotaxis protein CheA n=1 Tax=Kordiimonas sp. SCSIO 12603 TaxID=2829596 RepID=UPI002104D9A5|nr:chemotaxis protein CheA [Kordiimonas sp. SCSIO 12603]UTW57156.1 chemotaxis protein CheA [Kordiimonas sp. SCSIO 12603]